MKVNIDFSRLNEAINACFYAYLWCHKRYLILWGGAGSGKSVFAAQKLIYRIVTEPGHRFLCVRKVAATIRESQFALIKSVIRQWGLDKLFSIPKGSGDMTITYLPNGSQILFTGLDDAEKLKSITDITGIWIEEPSEISQEEFQQLDMRLRGITPNYKQIILTFNPIIAGHWLQQYWFEMQQPKALTIKTTYRDNQFIDPEYRDIIEAMKKTNPNWYKVYGLGEWGVYEGQFFNTWDSSIHTCRPFAIPKEWPRYRAMDWGSAKPYCVGWYAIDYDGRAYKYRELYGFGGKANVGTKETAKTVAQRIKKLEEGEEILSAAADPAIWIKGGSSGPSIAEDFENEGIYWSPANNDRLNGWSQVRNRLEGLEVNGEQRPWLVVFDTCVHTARTFPIQVHSKNKPEDMDSDGEDHAPDETRYFCMMRPWTPEKKEPEKPEDYGQKQKRVKASAWSA